MRENGFTDIVKIGNAKSFTYKTTEVIVYNTNYKQVAEKVSKILSTKTVKVEKDNNKKVDLTIIVGADCLTL